MTDDAIRKTQIAVLKVFGQYSKTFALAGGTALELYYFQHRFSRDLDFFSPTYDIKEIEDLVGAFEESLHKSVRLENTFTAPSHAHVRFYTVPTQSPPKRLKIDFVEDVLFTKPDIQKRDGVPVYAAKNIYIQKIKETLQ